MRTSLALAVLTVLATGAILFLSGCAQTDVAIPLGYAPVAAQPGRCTQRVTIVDFADERPDQRLGDRQGEVFFYPAGQTPSQWAARALAEELTLSGCLVQRVQGGGAAARGAATDADWVITGAVEKAYLKQTSLVDYDGSLRLRLLMERADGRQKFTKDVGVARQVTNLPSGRERTEILTGLMQDAMREAAPFLLEKMR